VISSRPPELGIENGEDSFYGKNSV